MVDALFVDPATGTPYTELPVTDASVISALAGVAAQLAAIATELAQKLEPGQAVTVSNLPATQAVSGPLTDTQLRVLSNTIGAVSAFGVNGTGITVAAGTYKGLVMIGNDCNDNTAVLSLGAVTVANWANYRVVDNPGINPRGTVTQPAVPASTVAATNTTGFRVTVYLKAGTLTVVTVNGVITGQAATPGASLTLPIALDPGGTIAVTYSVAPTWVWIAN